MFIDGLADRGAMPMLERTMAFAEARHRVIAENIANIDTPGYRTKQLDAGSFQAALRRAAEEQSRGGQFQLPATKQLRERGGRLEVRPTLEPAENLLFHDGTNARIERQMSQLAENGMTYQLAVELARGRYAGMLKAISGRVA